MCFFPPKTDLSITDKCNFFFTSIVHFSSIIILKVCSIMKQSTPILLWSYTTHKVPIKYSICRHLKAYRLARMFYHCSNIVVLHILYLAMENRLQAKFDFKNPDVLSTFYAAESGRRYWNEIKFLFLWHFSSIIYKKGKWIATVNTLPKIVTKQRNTKCKTFFFLHCTDWFVLLSPNTNSSELLDKRIVFYVIYCTKSSKLYLILIAWSATTPFVLAFFFCSQWAKAGS